MILTLPPRKDGQALTVDTADNRQIIIIGANGSGKTRFANRLMAELGPKAFRMSAIKAIYGKEEENSDPGSVDSLYHEATDGTASIIRTDIRGELERMLALMLNEEIVNLIDFKYNTADGNGKPQRAYRDKLPPTRLDRLIRLWQKIFPDNRVLIESGRMIFGHERSDDTYSSAKLSAGEKAVLYYIGASMFAPENGVIFVESPDMLLHPSSIRSLWDSIEQLRPDCTFIYITHDLSFASTRSDGVTIWVKSCRTNLRSRPCRSCRYHYRQIERKIYYLMKEDRFRVFQSKI